MVETGNFSYNDNDWFKKSPICTNGNRQSPINIISKNSQLALTIINPFRISGFNSVPETIEIVNSFHSIMINPDFGAVNHPIITGGPLKLNIYKFAQFHIHFGINSTSGTEHYIDGVGGPMEIHLVFFNGKYKTFENASDKSDGLCAIGFLFELSETATSIKIVDYLDKILIPETSYTIPEKFTLSSIFGTSPWPYYNYHGSLTTPPCTENVLWIVSRPKLGITSADVIFFFFLN